ncbi:alpha/beta hydrolase [Streptomyces thioluteus]|uniref:Hydrolase n=2 Tax=Streptomyces TaxID=1883 RepID=A0A2N8NXD1_STREU|nr:alpha/beta hydrolase [Streptomyces eurocidicus]MBB5120467.1 pimeloyl-ACP methyl ester carboxylesterase [Streptomyces eurocidicus]MBF6053679.1 alpha/beta fold hydrolase [Streptomyces eurocidicus]PNE33431.1 hydrolase [Streptomyces eurocidicus]
MYRKALSLALAGTAVAATTVAAVVAPGAPGATTNTMTTASTVAATPQSLKWGPCPKEAASPRLECTTLDVPLDYRHPHGRQIEIAVSRMASKDPAKRRGVLFTNPGGPGAAGLAYPAILAHAGLPKDVVDSYDVIGFDPRGVGRSTPVTCDLTPWQQQRGNFPPYAHTAVDVAREAKNAQAVARQCATSRTGWMLPHITTANTARDMDLIRAALGETKASYFGTSYGSYLGAAYASMFPERGDRILLDSNLGPGGYDLEAFRRLGRGMEDRFPDFAEFAAAHPRYGLGTTAEQVTAKFHELAKRLDAEPVGGMDGTLFRGMTFDRLYVEVLMPALAESWQALDKGKPVPPPSVSENLLASRFLVICGDSHWPTKIGTYQRNAAIDRAKYPLVGGSTGSIGPCAFWPHERPEPPVHIDDQGPSNVLMVQNERDPGTPLVGAQELRQAFGQRARLVTADQGGHGVYPFGSNTCANDTATAFLTTGRRPAKDLACAAEPTK